MTNTKFYQSRALFIAMLLFLVLPIYISFKIVMKSAIPIGTVFWKMPHFTPAGIFCQE